MRKIPLYMITGFLGSGKTTFMKKLISQFAQDYRLGIIQNEFAPVNTDAIELKDVDQPFQLLEVNNGSVFCVCLLSDFTSSLSEFIEDHQPDAVILEATGLADPIAIAEMILAPQLSSYIDVCYTWCIVDAANFLKINHLVNRINHQIQVADKVILNKIDLADQDVVGEVTRKIQKINPFVEIQKAQHCEIELEGLTLKDPFGDNDEKRNNQTRSMSSEGRPGIGLGVLKSGRKIRVEALRHFLEEFTSGSKTIRIKGYVRTNAGGSVAVQTIYDQIAITEANHYTGSTQLVAFGRDFNLSEFSKRFRSLAD